MVCLQDVQKVAMIGAGTMGSGMSLCFARAGYEVALFSRTEAGLERAAARIAASSALFVQEGLQPADAEKAARERIRATTRLDKAMDGVQFVLESVPERLDLKQGMFARLETLCAEDTILATNTSGLSITAIASACRCPGRVGGMHWANPGEIVPLVEVIRGEATWENTVDVIYGIAEKMGKVPVRVQKDIPGFASNRLQYAVLREALNLVEQGVVTIEDVDRTLKCGVGFRYPWLGQLETVDLGGLEVFHTICQYLFPELSAMTRTPRFFDKLIEQGKKGIKSGSGFYEYQPGDRDEILRRRDLYFIRQLKLIQATQAQPRGKADGA